MKQQEHWQDPVNALFGAFLLLSPWVAGYDSDTLATVNATVIGIALIAAAMGAMLVPRAWEEWTEALLGLWLVASPWLLGFGGDSRARAAAVVAGLAITLLALWALAFDEDYKARWRDRMAH